MSSTCNSIALILLCCTPLSELLLANDMGFLDPQNKVALRWSNEELFGDNILHLEWRILDRYYFGDIFYYVIKWNYTQVACVPSPTLYDEERIPVPFYGFDLRVKLYALYSITFCVESDIVTCEDFSKPFEYEYIPTNIATTIKQFETPKVIWAWKDGNLYLKFEEISCELIQGPLRVYYKAVHHHDENEAIIVSNIYQYPLQINPLVVQNLIPYYQYDVKVYLIRGGHTVDYQFSFMPDYEVVTETVTNLSMTSKGPDHIALRWLPPNNAIDKSTLYYVHIEHNMVQILNDNSQLTITKCTEWPEYVCVRIEVPDEGHYNISVFAVHPHDTSKVNLDIELDHAFERHLYRNVETDIIGIRSKHSSQPIVDCHGVTKVPGQDKVCPGDTIIDYKFSSDPIDSDVWTVEQYISGDPDWAFNIYRPDVVRVQNDGLHIKPKLEEELARNNLDLKAGCTQDPQRCFRNFMSVWNHPVVSGQLRSKHSFCFGNVTIRAKLPIGDYMYPEVYLEDVSNPQRRLLIAYARGNLNYVNINGLDDGGKKLFGGPYTDVKEPGKLRYLSSYNNSEHIGASWHTFNIIWTPDKIELYLDKKLFGQCDSQAVQAAGFDKDMQVRVVLGIGVGGPYNFPDQYTSSNKTKPYRSFSKNAIKDFVENKVGWHDTWSEDSQLLVDFVTVRAL